MHRTVKTSELRPGDVVNCHGLRCLIDRPIDGHECYQHDPGCHVYYTRALVLNRDEVPASVVPYSFTLHLDEGETEHRWTIQGNDLARWYVEVTS